MRGLINEKGTTEAVKEYRQGLSIKLALQIVDEQRLFEDFSEAERDEFKRKWEQGHD